MLFIETVFDTLNAKAAIFAAKEIAEETGKEHRWSSRHPTKLAEPYRANIELHHVGSHAQPLALGLNCSFGPKKCCLT